MLMYRWSNAKQTFKYEDLNVLSCNMKTESQRIWCDIENVKKLSKSSYNCMKNESDRQIGLEVMQLLVADILGTDTIFAKIFKDKAKHDFPYMMVVPMFSKQLACLVLVIYNVFIAVMTSYLIADRDRLWQLALVIACIVQFGLEFFFTTVECMLQHFALPNFIENEVKSSVRTIIRTIDHALACSSLWKRHSRRVPSLESSSYFFVSRQVATKFPHILECNVVLAFMSIFPRGKLAQHYKTSEYILFESSIPLFRVILGKLQLQEAYCILVCCLGRFPSYTQVPILRIVQQLLFYLAFILLVSITQDIKLLLIPLLGSLFAIFAHFAGVNPKQELLLPLVFESFDVEDYKKENSNLPIVKKEGSDAENSSTLARNRWAKVRSSISQEKEPQAMKKLVGKVKAQEIAVNQLDNSGYESANAQLLSSIASTDIEKIAKLIVDTSGVTMEVARAIAMSEIESQINRYKRHGDQYDENETEQMKSLNYIDLTLSRATSNVGVAAISRQNNTKTRIRDENSHYNHITESKQRPHITAFSESSFINEMNRAESIGDNVQAYQRSFPKDDVDVDTDGDDSIDIIRSATPTHY